MRLVATENLASCQLGVPVALALADRGPQWKRLSNAERGQLAACRSRNRRRDWLHGRAALKELLPVLGRGEDTGVLSFPEPALSLTHAGGIAVAAGTIQAGCQIGVDYEPLHAVRHSMARWFLDEREAAWLQRVPVCDRADHVIRLWTVKEAAFKGYQYNACLSLRDIAVTTPGARLTYAVIRESVSLVLTRPFAAGYLSIAIARESK